jgi:hypothetical protein
MTKKINKGSQNQSAPKNGKHVEFSNELVSGDNSKGNKRNKDQKAKKKK